MGNLLIEKNGRILGRFSSSILLLTFAVTAEILRLLSLGHGLVGAFCLLSA
jgi:hypothetical protein